MAIVAKPKMPSPIHCFLLSSRSPPCELSHAINERNANGNANKPQNPTESTSKIKMGAGSRGAIARTIEIAVAKKSKLPSPN